MGRKHRKATAREQRKEARSTGNDLAVVGALVLMLTVAGEPVVTGALGGVLPVAGIRIGDIPMVDGVLDKVPVKAEPAKQEPARKTPPAKAKR